MFYIVLHVSEMSLEYVLDLVEVSTSIFDMLQEKLSRLAAWFSIEVTLVRAKINLVNSIMCVKSVLLRR